MRVVFKLPDVAEGTAEAEIAIWHVKVGDVVVEDQVLVDVMTDKATVEIPSPFAGKVVEIHGKAGDKVAVGSELIVFETAASSEDPVAEAAVPRAPLPTATGPAPGIPSKEVPGNDALPLPLASPSLRRRAREIGVDLAQVTGTGPGGRITERDLAEHSREIRHPAEPAQPPVPALEAAATGVTTVPITGLRRRIAERMQESKRRIPHFSYIEEVDVTRLEDLRRYLNERTTEGASARLSVLPFIVLALVRALPSFPHLNARFDDDAGLVRVYEQVHVGIATQTAKGLVVPVLRDAGNRDLWQCAAEIARLAKIAREQKASKEELTGSTITITSLGKLGGLATTPIINYPEVAVVGVNKVNERAAVHGGRIVVRQTMNLSSSFDHRVVDGWDAAAFVQKLKTYLEEPAELILSELIPAAKQLAPIDKLNMEVGT